MNHHDKRPWSRRVVLGAGIALLSVLTACGTGGPEGEPLATSRAGDLSWSLWLDPNPARQGG